MLDQRLFLQAANHFRAGRISISDFQEKVYNVPTKKTATRVLVISNDTAACDTVQAAAETSRAQVTMLLAVDPNDANQINILKASHATVIVDDGQTDFTTLVESTTGPVIVVPTEATVIEKLFERINCLKERVCVVAVDGLETAGMLAAKIKS